MPLFLHVDITYFVCNTYQSKVTIGTDQFTFSSTKSADKLGLGILFRFSNGIQDWIKMMRIRKGKGLLSLNYEAIFFYSVFPSVYVKNVSRFGVQSYEITLPTYFICKRYRTCI